jgi:hypothetical protein
MIVRAVLDCVVVVVGGAAVGGGRRLGRLTGIGLGVLHRAVG